MDVVFGCGCECGYGFLGVGESVEFVLRVVVVLLTGFGLKVTITGGDLAAEGCL